MSINPRAVQAADDMFDAAFGWRPGGTERAPEPSLPPRTCTCEAGQPDVSGHHYEACPALDDR
jgi:hypothetical protein